MVGTTSLGPAWNINLSFSKFPSTLCSEVQLIFLGPTYEPDSCESCLPNSLRSWAAVQITEKGLPYNNAGKTPQLTFGRGELAQLWEHIL